MEYFEKEDSLSFKLQTCKNDFLQMKLLCQSVSHASDDDMPTELLDFAQELDRSLITPPLQDENESCPSPTKRLKTKRCSYSLCDLPRPALEIIASCTVIPRATCRLICTIADYICREKVTASMATCIISADNRIARAIETSLHLFCRGQAGKRYRQKARELLLNLRRNSSLRERVTIGAVQPEALVRMCATDLASPELKRERSLTAARSMEEITKMQHDIRVSHTVTERFECAECGYSMTQYGICRRKQAVDRVRVVIQCLRCRMIWEL